MSTTLAIVEHVRGTVSEPTLLTRIAARDPLAIDEAYRMHHAALRAFARRFVGDADVAEDMVHDVFVALPDALRRFRGDSSLRTLMMAIAVKRGHKHIRAACRRRAAMAKFAAQPLPQSPRPDAALAQQQAAAMLYGALDQLSDEHRAAFVLCEIDQLSAGDAAALVGVPEATVRTRLFHARKKLRSIIGEEAL